VHTVEEIALLRSRFPQNIRLFVASHGGKPVGGAVMYLSDQVAHAQYIASNAAGRDLGALDLLFLTLLERLKGFRYFDFGISTEENGTKLNKGLIEFKEGFGARAVIHDHYLVKVA
jgi:lipid II:glycine glycyltransferase (peptidoglycan interpeptide bridge formation enzyme)